MHFDLAVSQLKTPFWIAKVERLLQQMVKPLTI